MNDKFPKEIENYSQDSSNTKYKNGFTFLLFIF